MRKVAIAFAALAAFGIAMALTSSAKAEEARIVIKKDRDHDRYMDRHHKKIIVIEHRRHHYRDRDHD